MTKPVKAEELISGPRLDPHEKRDIDHKIKLETAKMFHSMVKLGAFANIIGGLLYVLAIYERVETSLILYWYAVLFLVNLSNVLWALRFEYTRITHYDMQRCRKGFIYLLILICLIWGAVGILFMSDGLPQQLTTIIFLSAVLICFSFSTAIDLTMGITSIICLLLPSILYHLYLVSWFYNQTGTINSLHVSIAGAFLMLGLFMMIACVIGNKVLIKVLRLGYENELLRQKLEGLNITLENRVKERTQELENSLSLVTYQATHDLLTELPNERLLHEYLSSATERAVKNHYKFAVSCFSLNNMSKIKDGIGHQAAATLIQRVAQRFVQVFDSNKRYFISLSRQDVFIVLIEPIVNLDELTVCAEGLFSVLKEPVWVAKQSLNLTGSIGVSVFPVDGRDTDTLITNAEAARVLASKRGGNSIRLYNTDINADGSRLLNIENLLYHAVENDELILNYQPFIDVNTEKIYGAEALVRWQNPDLGLIPPLEFIPIAETNGMILPIGEWVLRTACKQLKSWHDKGFNTLKISINLSAKQLEQENLVELIGQILKECNLSPKFLELELTESEVFHQEAVPIINQFVEMGISLAIDDFGTGYSEFSSLKLFKVDKIKIDKTFIQDIGVSIDSRNIVCNTIALANRMNIACLAEGVETEKQVQFLRENGCFIMQGYYFSRPLSAPSFFELLKSYPKTTIPAKIKSS